MKSAKALGLADWILAGLITIAAVALNVKFWVHIGGLWRDEVNLVNLSSHHSIAEMANDSFPVLMPLLIHVWRAIGLGNTDLDLRLLGLLIGAGVLITLWISMWKVHRRPPLFGLALFALNSSLIVFGDSLRAYGLGSIFVIALTASAFIFLQKPSKVNLIWFILFAVLSVQVLFQSAVIVAAICFGAWAVCCRRGDRPAALQILLVAVLSAGSLLPYAESLMRTSTNSDVLRTGVSLGRFFASYQDTLGYPRSWYIYIWVLLYAVIVIRVVAGIWPPRAKAVNPDAKTLTRDLNLFAAVSLTIAAMGFPLFFWRAQLPMQSWYVLPFMAFVVVCFDASLPVFNSLSRSALIVFAAATAFMSIPATNMILNGHFSNVNLYAKLLAKFAAPQDYIIVEPWFFGITFDHYFNGSTPWNTLPPISDHTTHRFDLVQRQLENTNAIAPVFSQIERTLQSGHRVWILSIPNWMGVPPAHGLKPPASLPPAPLKDSGWADWPYAHVWAAQVACFIKDRSAKFVQLQDLSHDRFITEDMILFMADGWNTNAVTPP